MPGKLKNTPTKAIEVLLKKSKSQLKTWENLVDKDLPVAEMEAMGCQLLNTFLQRQVPELIGVAFDILETLFRTRKLSFQGYITYGEVCILKNELSVGLEVLIEAQAHIPPHQDDNEASLALLNALHARLQMRVEMLNNHFEEALVYFKQLSNDDLNRDPHIRILGSIAYSRLASLRGKDWEQDTYSSMALTFDYEKRFGENFDVFVERAIGYENLKKYGLAYESFEKAFQYIQYIEPEDQLIERTVISLGLWRLLQVKDPFKRIRIKALTPKTDIIARMELLRRSAADGKWEEVLSLTKALQVSDLTISEALLISFAAIEKGEYRRAREVLDAIGHDEDGNVQRLQHLSRLSYVEGDHKKALTYSEKAVKFCIDANVSLSMVTPILQMAVHLMHEYAHRHKDYDRFIKFLESFPKDWQEKEIKILLVQMMMNADTVRRERQYVKRGLRILKSIKAKERQIDWFVLSGRLLMLQEKFEEAIKAFMNAKDFLNTASEGAQTLEIIINNSIEDCVRALHENETGEGEGILGHARLMNQTFVELGITVHRIVQVEEGTMPIAIIERPNNTTPNAHLITLAQSYRQAPFENLKPAEIGMAIPKSEVKTIQPDDWRVRLLATLSQSFQAQKGIRPRMGMSLKNPMGGPLIEGIKYPSVLLFDSWETFIPESAPIALVEVVPAYEEENDYAALMGSERLLHRLMDIPFYPTKAERENAFPGQNWKMLIPRHKIRRIYEDHGMFGCVSKDILINGADAAVFYRDNHEQGSPNNSGWIFLTGNETEEEVHRKDQFAMIDLNTICNYIPYVKTYLDAPYGSAFVRDASGSISVTTCEKSASILQRVNKKPLLA